MKILIVRHGDPDYSIDGLTEKGKKEVEFLADRLCRENIKKVYCSTLGRARLTAQPTLDRLGIKAEYCEWLREFGYVNIEPTYTEYQRRCWDLMPRLVNECDALYSPTEWKEIDFVKKSDLEECLKIVTDSFDETLAKHGYVRDGRSYRVVNSNHDTIVFVCHFGIEAQLLGHIFSLSPFSIAQNTIALPSSVTTLYSEEREEGIAQFKMCGFGDVSHLYANNEEPAFSGRFCECFTDDTRH